MATTRLFKSRSPLSALAIAIGKFWLPPLKAPMSRPGGAPAGGVLGAAGPEGTTLAAPVREKAVTAPRLTFCQLSENACCNSDTSCAVVP